jgi:DNA-binding CsgD family transcriptional regulator
VPVWGSFIVAVQGTVHEHGEEGMTTRRAVRSEVHAPRATGAGIVPRDLEALADEDEDFVVLSFSLPQHNHETLTPAESEVASFVVAGRTNAEIAALRGTSVRTAANQVATLFRKLGVRSRLELVTSAPLLESRAQRKGDVA